MSSDEYSLSIRINLPNGGRFGPGKAALLEAISEQGSITKAAEALSMSYPRALKLIEQMNTDFTAPLIKSTHGGKYRGGSDLTEAGKTVLALYHSITDTAFASNVTALKKLWDMEPDDMV
ncbi:MAG: LysR family transcriptional regulator [Henriciella sp.]|uniref:winged helix-turn-helix domain-containing protein n=1 Tax=Henriciella sp. TaxID=1968823 RepID=UPI003C739ED9